MKPLRPTRRRKRRYVLVKFLKGSPMDPREWAIEKIKKVLGIWGFARAVLKVERVDSSSLLVVADREWAELVAGALVLLKEPFVPVTYLSGTRKALRRKNLL